ncbi:MAG: ABC transporter permease, partial [Pirellulaceae bacterium]
MLTIISMALGVMLVVGVLTIYGLVSESFRSNSSFGFNMLAGARGGGVQLTMSSVVYLSSPVENIPYEYYLAFSEKEVRQEQLKNSIAFRALALDQISTQAALTATPSILGQGWSEMSQELVNDVWTRRQLKMMKIQDKGVYSSQVEFAVPILLGDFYKVPDRDVSFRVCATNSDFFDKLVLDFDTEEKFRFREGRSFSNDDPECGLYGAVIGSVVARRSNLVIGSEFQVTHGVPGDENSHLHDQLFKVVGILEPTGTPNDRVVFINMEGFYLINDHVKPIVDDSLVKFSDGDEPEDSVDPFADQADDIFADGFEDRDSAETDSKTPVGNDIDSGAHASERFHKLPIEQREITSLLIRTSQRGDDWGNMLLADSLGANIEQGGLLEKSLRWSAFRPKTAQKSVQCVNPVQQVTSLFAYFIEPARWVLLSLTTLICLVSSISILVGIYNSMSQRRHEIAVMRALGARRSHVMSIMMSEALLLSLAGGILGWFAGHGLTALLGPIVENQTGVPVRFWDLAPAEPVFAWLSPVLGNSNFSNFL